MVGVCVCVHEDLILAAAGTE